jgi:predicted RNase H-like HicB family nuclease
MKSLDYYKSLDYDIVVKREELDGEKWYVAYCREFGVNACHGIGDTREEAIQSYLVEKDLFIELLYSKNEVVPEPIEPDDSYSGIFSVRTSPWIHSMIANQAKKEGVSINAYINQILAFCAGQDAICNKFGDYANKLAERLSKQYEMIMNSIDDIQYCVPQSDENSSIVYQMSA